MRKPSKRDQCDFGIEAPRQHRNVDRRKSHRWSGVSGNQLRGRPIRNKPLSTRAHEDIAPEPTSTSPYRDDNALKREAAPAVFVNRRTETTANGMSTTQYPSVHSRVASSDHCRPAGFVQTLVKSFGA